MKEVAGGVCAPIGFSASGIHSGIKQDPTQKDLALIYSETQCTAACVYTQNKVIGAPLVVTKKNMADPTVYGIICNSGNANTSTVEGEVTAERICYLIAQATGRATEDFIIASTGVIGVPLPITPFEQHIPTLVNALAASHQASIAAATAIMTTDTAVKEHAFRFALSDGQRVTIGGIAKGSGMIHPNMGTMLAFLTTDIAIASELLQEALQEVVAETFNQISVDGDTSTNDMVTLLANGRATVGLITEKDANYILFKQAIHQVCLALARDIARDGEGATKLVTCQVQQAPTKVLAAKIAKQVISSNLLKAAMFGQDANWGRVISAIGNTPGEFSVENIGIHIQSSVGRLALCQGSAALSFSEMLASNILAESEVDIIVNMNDGQAAASAWGCDLTYDYVTINGDYRS